MTRRYKRITHVFAFTIAQAIITTSQADNLKRYAGEIVKKDFAVGICDIGTMTVKYNIDSKGGKPMVRGSYSWEAAYGTPNNCLNEDLVVWLKIRNGKSVGYIRLVPKVPKAVEGISKPFASEVKWDDFFCVYKGKEKQSCFSKRISKDIFKNGEIVGFALS